jgi:hypothetical protein
MIVPRSQTTTLCVRFGTALYAAKPSGAPLTAQAISALEAQLQQ